MNPPAHDPFETRRLFTVGHSNRTLQGLLELLHAAHVRTLVDVRRFPNSRRHPHFNRTEMRGFLLKSGIIYHHLGKELGGFTEQSYESYMSTTPFRRGLEKLEDLASSSVTAILCAERDPAECHRSYISDALLDREWQVAHLLGPEQIREHDFSEKQRKLF